LSSIVGNANANSVAGSFSNREIVRIQQDGGSHNAFDLVARSNGELYLSVGDGTANSLSDTAYRLQYAQNLDEVYGKIIRFNPDPAAFTVANGLGRVSDNGNYSIPNSNPYFDGVGGNVDEIYANGVRSPFRLTLDPNDEDVLWVGDVGEGSREDISRVTRGANLGWGAREGTNNVSTFGQNGFVLKGNTTLTQPEFEYSHANRPSQPGVSGGGVAVMGGFIYRGSLLKGLQGKYIGAELGNYFLSGNISRLFFGTPDGDDFNAPSQPAAFVLDPAGDTFDNVNLNAQGLPNLITGIAEGLDGELWVYGLEGSGTPGIDEGDGIPGRLIVAKILPVEPRMMLIDGSKTLGNGDFVYDVLGEAFGLPDDTDSPVVENLARHRAFVQIGNEPGDGMSWPGWTILRVLYPGGNNTFGSDGTYGFAPGAAGTIPSGQVFANSGTITLTSAPISQTFNVGDTIQLDYLLGSDSGGATEDGNATASLIFDQGLATEFVHAFPLATRNGVDAANGFVANEVSEAYVVTENYSTVQLKFEAFAGNNSDQRVLIDRVRLELVPISIGVLWDQEPDPSGIAIVHQDFLDAPPFSVFVVTDVDFPAAVEIGTVSVFFSNTQSSWPGNVTMATLNIFTAPGGLGDPTSGIVVPIDVTDVGGFLEIQASGLNIPLAAGQYFIGLSPMADSQMVGQEFHLPADSFDGIASMYRNPSGAFGLPAGTLWGDVDDLQPGYPDAAMRITSTTFGGPATFEPPATFQVFRGTPVSGGLAEMQTSNDVRAIYNPGFTLNSTEAPAWLIFDANVGGSTNYDFRVESQAGTPGLTYTIEAFNFTTNGFDVIGTQMETFSTDSVESYTLTSDHFDGNGDVRSRLGWRQTGFTLNFPWEARVDQVGWDPN